MNRTDEIRTLAIREKETIWNWFHGNHGARIPHSLNKLQKHELNTLLLLSIEKPVELCRFLRTPFFRLEYIMNHPSYQFFTIEKKKGGNREIYAPDPELKKIQKQLNYFLQAYYLAVKPKEVYGFVINPHYLGEYCNIVENATHHVGKKHLLNIDLKDFFPGISANRVRAVFRSEIFGFNDQISTALTLLTTFQGKLPIGAPTSPVISNFVCHQLDTELTGFCQIHNLTYTRYADDLTFSSNDPIIPLMIEGIVNQIRNNHFEINTRKTRLTANNRKQSVTGITVNEKVNVDRKLLKKIRAMSHDLSMNGIVSATRNHFDVKGEVDPKLQERFMNRLCGYINFIGQVRGKSDLLYLKVKSAFHPDQKENIR
jgi:RNA-directed DNA polymerase